MGLSFQARGEAAKPDVASQPEDVFLAWLLAQPADADLAKAADRELDRLSRYEGVHPGPAMLARLFRDLRTSLCSETPGASLQ